MKAIEELLNNSLEMKNENTHWVGVSSGIAIGNAFIYENAELEIKRDKDEIPFEEKLSLLNSAIEKTKTEISILYESLKKANPQEAEIFRAHTFP